MIGKYGERGNEWKENPVIEMTGLRQQRYPKYHSENYNLHFSNDLGLNTDPQN